MECIINAQEVTQLLKIPVSQSPTCEEHNFTFYCSPPQGRRYRGAGGVHAAATKIQVGPTMYQRATYMRDGSPVPLPGHIQDVRETTAVPGAPAEEVGCRLVNVPASSLRCMPQFFFLSPPPPLPSSSLSLSRSPSPPLLSPPPPTHLHKGVITMTWLMFVKLHQVRKKLKAARAQHLERHQHRARVSP